MGEWQQQLRDRDVSSGEMALKLLDLGFLVQKRRPFETRVKGS